MICEVMMLKERVLQRLEDLGISQWDAAIKAGLHRNFVYDLLEGRKLKPQRKSLAALARALRCSTEYLTGESDDIGEPTPLPAIEASGLPVVGIVEDDAWRRPTKQDRGRVMIQPDPRFRGAQPVYLYRGESRDGLEDGMYVLAVDIDDYRDVADHPAGKPVIVEMHRRSLGEVQTVIRPWAPDIEPSLRSADVDAKVVAVVVATFRLF